MLDRVTGSNEFKSIEEYHAFLEEEYSSIKDTATSSISEKGIAAPTYRIEQDPRKSLDLYYPLPIEAQHAVREKVLQPLKTLFQTLDSNQVVFNPDQLHMSSVVIIASEAEFNPETDDVNRYYEIINQSLAKSRPVEINFNRVIPFPGNPGGILIGGFPSTTMEPQNTRERVKKAIDSEGLRRVERRPLRICHSTVARWDSPLDPERAKCVLDLTKKLDRNIIWQGELDTLVFAIGGYNTSAENTRILKVFNLHE